MNQPRQPSLRFDHRAIAVIFSLFVFVSLLMFTVGILVGKGLTMAKYEGQSINNAAHHVPAAEVPHPVTAAVGEALEPSGTSVTTERGAADGLGDSYEPPISSATEPEPLKMVPKKGNVTSALGDTLLEGSNRAKTSDILKNPRVRALLEGQTPKKRSLASKPSSKAKIPSSSASGAFTVQIGSYPAKKDAEQRVNTLKKMGFAHAYFSAKELGDKKTTWFRVWLGFYPDFQTAKQNAEYLQKKGEVKNYLVRKAETTG